MKKLLFAMAILLMAACSQKNEYKIDGKISGLKQGTAYLKTLENGSLVEIDTAEIKDGEFVFTGNVKEPLLYLIFIEGKPKALSFFLDNSHVRLSINPDSLDKSKIKGLKINEPWVEFMNNVPMEKEADRLKEQFLKAQSTNDITQMNKIRDEYSNVVEQQKKYYEDFVWKNTGNIVGAYLSLSLAPTLEIDSLKQLVEKLKAGSAANSKYVKTIEDGLKSMEEFNKAEELTKIGKTAPDFDFKNIKGETLKLSSLKGKTVLIDFWASWCRPCRNENPNVVAAYKKYNNKGFEVLSISLDKDQNEWQNAIREDGLIWINHHWDDEGKIANIYGVKSIPHTLLIDKNGVIIAKDLRGEDLETNLKTLQ